MPAKQLALIIILLVYTCQNAAAQQILPLQKKWEFHSINQVGLLEGAGTSAFQLQSVNGFKNSKWFAGVGLGLDYYTFKTIPLFVDLRRYLGSKGNVFFLYADAGANFAWSKEILAQQGKQHFQPGFYASGGAGYELSFKKGGALLLSAGYSYKRVKQIQTQDICPFVGPCYEMVNTYTYNLNRLLLQVGWQF